MLFAQLVDFYGLYVSCIYPTWQQLTFALRSTDNQDDFDESPAQQEVAPVKTATKKAPATKVKAVKPIEQIEEAPAASTPVKIQEKIGSFSFPFLEVNGHGSSHRPSQSTTPPPVPRRLSSLSSPPSRSCSLSSPPPAPSSPSSSQPSPRLALLPSRRPTLSPSSTTRSRSTDKPSLRSSRSASRPSPQRLLVSSRMASRRRRRFGLSSSRSSKASSMRPSKGCVRSLRPAFPPLKRRRNRLKSPSLLRPSKPPLHPAGAA